MATTSNIDTLPEECVSAILWYTYPPDACRLSMVSPTLRSAADSDVIWRSFLPSDYEDILSRAVNPLTLKSSSCKHLFCLLCRPLLLDGGNKSFKLDKFSGKKSYILSARELSITWSNDPMYWSWRSMPESRFAAVAELRTVSWLEIHGKIRTRLLTPNTTYAAYLVMKVSHRAYGLDSAPSEVSVVVANKVQQRGRAYLCHKDEENKHKKETFCYYRNPREMLGETLTLIQEADEEEEGVPHPSRREDGWMEIELGEFFVSGDGGDDEEVKMSLMEVGYRLKGGLILEGIEVRPKQESDKK